MIDSWTVVVERPGVTAPWGLRLSGGVDCRQPLRVAQVRKRSLADKAGLKIGDYVASVEGISTDRLTHRQVLDLIGSQRLSLTFVVSRQQQQHSIYDQMSSSLVSPITDNDRSFATHGLLTYLPTNSSKSTPDMASAGLASPTDEYRGPTWKSSYRSPPFKPVATPALKTYQPFDMSGRNTNYHVASPTVARPPPPQQQLSYDSATYGNYNMTNSPATVTAYTADVGAPTATSSRPYADVAPPSVLTKVAVRHNRPTEKLDQSFWSQRTSYYNSEDEQPRSCAQSRTFYILEAVLNEQGSGEKGLPPPPPRTSTLEDSSAVVIGIHSAGQPSVDLKEVRHADPTPAVVTRATRAARAQATPADVPPIEVTHAKVFPPKVTPAEVTPGATPAAVTPAPEMTPVITTPAVTTPVVMAPAEVTPVAVTPAVIATPAAMTSGEVITNPAPAVAPPAPVAPPSVQATPTAVTAATKATPVVATAAVETILAAVIPAKEATPAVMTPSADVTPATSMDATSTVNTT